jgi:mono/diheme cytochrome c family protein
MFLVAGSFLVFPGAARSQTVTFADIAPILSARCVICHTGDAAPLGLRLDSMESLLRGSQYGPVVKSGDAAGSELIRRLTGARQPRMPMTGPPFLSESEVALFERWVNSGLKSAPQAGASQPAPVLPPVPATGQSVTYAQVAPIFAKRCAKCHTENGLMGPAPEGYRLTSYQSTVSISDRVRVVPDNSAASELVRRIRGQARPRMPYDGPPYLSESEIGLIEEWIRQGARSAEGNAAVFPAGASLRLHGTLNARWKLDDLDVVVTSSTRLDKSPRIGDYVQVRARLAPDGTIIAERIRPR